MQPPVHTLCGLRLWVGFLGQRGEARWWGTDFLSPAGREFLAYNFQRQPLLAGFTATCAAAQRLHDERIGRRKTYHLFRLPAGIEAEIHRTAIEANGERLSGIELNRTAAVEALRQNAGESVDASEGPVQVGELDQALSERGLQEMAKHYLSAFRKLLHPSGECTDAEFEEYVAYAIEGRRRIKEQLNKRKDDEEFAEIRLAYVNAAGNNVEVVCPESKGVPGTQAARQIVPGAGQRTEFPQAPEPPRNVGPALSQPASEPTPATATVSAPQTAAAVPLVEKHFTIHYGDTGYSCQSLFGAYLAGAKVLTIEDPYIRKDYQLRNLIQVCELAVHAGTIKRIELVTGADHDSQKQEIEPKFKALAESLADAGVEFTYRFDDKLHDRELRTDTGWHIQIGRGLDIYQKPDSWLQIGASNLDLRPCMETKVGIFGGKNVK